MTQRTCDIIKACKGWFFPNIGEPLERVKHYMASKCYCKLSAYTRATLDRIMFDAMCDYVDSCDKPSFFLKTMDDLFEKEYLQRAEQIAYAFMDVEVQDNNGYVNGFTEELWAETERKYESCDTENS